MICYIQHYTESVGEESLLISVSFFYFLDN